MHRQVLHGRPLVLSAMVPAPYLILVRHTLLMHMSMASRIHELHCSSVAVQERHERPRPCRLGGGRPQLHQDQQSLGLPRLRPPLSRSIATIASQRTGSAAPVVIRDLFLSQSSIVVILLARLGYLCAAGGSCCTIVGIQPARCVICQQLLHTTVVMVLDPACVLSRAVACTHRQTLIHVRILMHIWTSYVRMLK